MNTFQSQALIAFGLSTIWDYMCPGSHPLIQANEESHVAEWGPDVFKGAGPTEGFSEGGGQSYRHHPIQLLL